MPAGATQIAEVRVRDPTAESEMLPVIEGAHATRRWGLRFVDDAVEDAYRLWFEQQAVQLTRIGALVASFGWVMTVVVVGIALPERMAWLLGWVLLVVMPGILAAVAASYVPAWRSRMLPLTALSIALAGLVLVGPHLAVGLDQPEATGGTIVVLLFAFTIFRLTLVQALLATIPFVVLDVGIAWAHFQRGELDLTQGVIHTTLPAGVFVLGAAVHLLRSRLLRDAFRKEQIIAQQHEVITRERDRADQLLLNILPRETATQLKSGARVIADAHEDVTVLFADLVGFTRIAATLEPQDLVAYLDDLFSRFDRLADELGVEKIRTMGDGYLAVGGLPTPRPDHAKAVVRLAEGMLAEAAECRDAHGVDWQLRIGVHSGPVVAGVIGRRKFTYDLWGNTVNVASRLEDAGEPGRIHVSEVTLNRLGDIDDVSRVPTHLRDVGPIRAGFLDPPVTLRRYTDSARAIPK